MVNIASLFSAAPSRESRDVRYRQGVIVSFDQNTLENVVNVGGVNLVNLPLLGVADVVTLTAGSVVGVLLIGEGNAQTWAIIGRFVAPNTSEAEEAISLLSSLTMADFVTTQETAGSTTYGDLTTVGPSVTLAVGPSGRLLVTIGATISASQSLNANSAMSGGQMTVEFTGTNTISPTTADDDLVATNAWLVSVPGQNVAIQNSMAFSASAVFEGLTPGGATTVTAKYRKHPSFNAGSTTFSNRSLTVVKL